MTAPILLQHGVFADGRVFDAWVRYFEAAGFECHAPSLGGRNPTDIQTLGTLTLSDNLDTLRAAREELSEPPIVIGHSMGGLLAQQLAAETTCAALVLVASSPPGVLWAHPRALRYLLALMPKILAGRAFRPSDKVLRAVVFNALDETEAQELASVVVPDSGKAFRAQVLGTARVTRGAVKCPVLVLSGDRDINGSPAIHRRLARRYDAKHHIIPGADHWIIAPSHAETTCPLILDWLREVELSSPVRVPAAERLGATPSRHPRVGSSLSHRLTARQ